MFLQVPRFYVEEERQILGVRARIQCTKPLVSMEHVNIYAYKVRITAALSLSLSQSLFLTRDTKEVAGHPGAV